MVILSQVIPFSIEAIIPIISSIIFSTITVWLSAQLVSRGARIQNAVVFSLVVYAANILLGFFPIPSFPFISTRILVEVIIKSLVAMKFFSTDFRGGICIAGVQIIFGMILILPF